MANAVHLPCARCSSLNRVLHERLRDNPTCGRCKAALFGDHPAALSDATFQAYVEGSELPVVVDFWAAWCGPCRAMAPQFEAASRSARGQALFAKVDTEAARQVASRYAIQSIPTLIAFRGGREVARQSGAMSERQITTWLTNTIASRSG